MFRTRRAGLVRLATAYSEVTEGAGEELESLEVTIPEDLSSLSAGQLEDLRVKATEAFQMLYESEPTDETLSAMEQLADGVDRIRLAEDSVAQASQDLASRVEELAGRVGTSEQAVAPELNDEDDDDDDDEELSSDVDEELSTDDSAESDDDDSSVTASDRPAPIHLTVSGRRRRTREPQPVEKKTGFSLTASADLGRGAGAKMTLPELSSAFGEKLGSVDFKQMDRAARTNKHSVQSFGIGKLHKDFPPELTVDRGSDVDEVLRYAASESRLPGESLVASGSSGWCAPSEVIYELAEAAETTDGIFSLPEVAVPRGGLLHTLGPDFSSIFGEDTLSWSFTEDEVEAGDYDGYGGGSKPSFFVECPEPVDDRLNAAGIFIKAGLLMNAAYPEVIERLVSGALVAHEFKMARRRLQTIEAGSTSVNMPADAVGSAAPVLQAVEVQIEDYRNRHRIGRGRTVEVILPHWVRGSIRADLSRRLGVDMLAVTNDMITGFFALRGANVQFVYELDDLTGNVADRTSFPTTVKALIYLAGTWISGTNAVIDLGALFDSALVEQNIYTQLFTEEGWLVAKRFHDSRVVNIPICPSGETGGGVSIDCDGSADV